jgi:hypothetical protein
MMFLANMWKTLELCNDVRFKELMRGCITSCARATTVGNDHESSREAAEKRAFKENRARITDLGLPLGDAWKWCESDEESESDSSS